MRFIAAFILFLSVNLQAQPVWRLFHPGDVAYYKPMSNEFGYNDHYAWYTLDSLPERPYTRYYFHKNLMGNKNEYSVICKGDHNKGWAGIRADVTDTSVVFYNRHDLPILFKTNTRVGDTWPVNYSDTMQYFFEHVRDTIEQVINAQDSVRWYHVKKMGRDEVLYSIALSKHHGMFYMFNVWHFLDLSNDNIFVMTRLDYTKTLKLNSRKSIPGLLQNFTLWECYPYQPGDEVHEYQTHNEIHYSKPLDWDSSIITIKYLERNIIGDSILLLKREERKFTRRMMNGNYSTRFTVDTNTIQLPKNTDFNREPGYPVNKEMLALSEYKGHAVKRNTIGGTLKGSGPWCVENFFADASPQHFVYIKGVGKYLVYDSYESILSVTYTSHIPFYYKQGSTTWGTPYAFTLGMYDSPKPINIYIYPNPTHDTIHVQCGDVIQSVRIYDMKGKLCVQQQINDVSKAIAVSELQPGLYYLHVVSQNGTAIKKWVKE